MIIKKILLSNTFVATLSFATSMAAGTHSVAGLETRLVAKDRSIECKTIDDSTAAAWNAGEICLESDPADTSAKAISVATDQGLAGLTVSQDILGVSSTLGAKCVSAGSSTSATQNAEGFCLAADMSTSEMDFARFSVANGLPATGMQFLQALFGDGSTQSASAPVATKCGSAGGSTSATENSNGFCLHSDLSRSLTDFARFSVANALPVMSLQFLQVKFANSSPLGGSLLSGIETECVSVGSSTAATGTTVGFCLVSDLSTSAEFSNFSLAHSTPVTDLQFLQVTFENGNLSGGSLPSPSAGAECISIDGSIAAIGDPEGSCLLSELIGSSTGSADIAVANGLPVSGLQLLQATFGEGGSLASPGFGVECVSADGSTAATGNAEGFCLVSDRGTPTTGFANLSIANDLPIATLQFLQVPFRDDTQLGSLRYKLGEGAPMGAFIFDPAVRLRQPPLPSIVGVAGHKNQYFRITQRRTGINIQSSSAPLPEFWLSL